MKTETELFEQLIATALTSEPSKFEFIRNIEQYGLIKRAYKGLKSTVKLFKHLVESLTDTYVMAIQLEAQKVDQLILLRQLIACYDYYDHERLVAKNMLSEYRAYVWKNLRLSALVGAQRLDTELFDHRKLL